MKPARPHHRPRSRRGWAAIRRRVIERDGCCLKCRSTTGLEAHHKIERSMGGPDTLKNLVTLCGHCHDEWTVAEPPAELMSFDQWLTIPPARYLVLVFSRDWPDDTSAAQFKRDTIATIDLARQLYEAGR